MLLFSPTISARLQYIAKTLFSTIECTNNVQAFIESNEPKINYSTEPISPNELWIKPHGLLEETGIKEQIIKVVEWENVKIFFKTEGGIQFDFLAASFYLITRYEEYLPHEKDMYGRYAHTNSIAFKHNFLHLPLVNLWMQKIEQYLPPLTAHHSRFTIHDLRFSYIPTYDIDIAYSYLHHSTIKNVGGFFKDLINGKIDAIAERLQVLTQVKKDPFDVYEWLHQLHKEYHVQPIYFFLLAQKRKGYDKNIAPQTKGMTQLIAQHSEQYTVGIHPSWQSNNDENILANEIKQLKKIIHQPIEHSRQHYIKMSLPLTYETLIEQGIQHDYSMGYGSINGFRASYTLPFHWYNLAREESTNLQIHPFCFMEANSFFEQKFTAEEAANELQSYFEVVKKVNGTLITIFHNHFLTHQPLWIEWRNMYEQFLKVNFASTT